MGREEGEVGVYFFLFSPGETSWQMITSENREGRKRQLLPRQCVPVSWGDERKKVNMADSSDEASWWKKEAVKRCQPLDWIQRRPLEPFLLPRSVWQNTQAGKRDKIPKWQIICHQTNTPITYIRRWLKCAPTDSALIILTWRSLIIGQSSEARQKVHSSLMLMIIIDNNEGIITWELLSDYTCNFHAFKYCLVPHYYHIMYSEHIWISFCLLCFAFPNFYKSSGVADLANFHMIDIESQENHRRSKGEFVHFSFEYHNSDYWTYIYVSLGL